METKGIGRLLACCAMFFAVQGCGGRDVEEERVSPGSDFIAICLICPVPATLVGNVNPTSIALDGTYFYFTNAKSLPYELDRAPLAGGAKTVLATNNTAMNSLTRFETNLYWGDFSDSLSAGGAWSMSTPGGTAFQISKHDSDAFFARQAVAVYEPARVGTIATIAARHVLFASVLDAAIWDHRSLLFSNSEVSLLPPVDPVTHLTYYPYAMVLDASKVYFTHDGGDGLWSAPLSGGAATQLASGVNRDSLAIAAGQLYFQQGANLVSMPAAGGAVTTLVANVDTISQIVEHAGVLYWTSASKGTVSKLPLATGVRGVLASSQTSPAALAVDDTYVYFGTTTALKRIAH